MDYRVWRKGFFRWGMTFVIRMLYCFSILLPVLAILVGGYEEVLACVILSGILMWIAYLLRRDIVDYQNYGRKLHKRLRLIVGRVLFGFGALSLVSILMGVLDVFFYIGIMEFESFGEFLSAFFISVLFLLGGLGLSRTTILYEKGIKPFKKSFVFYHEIDSVQLKVTRGTYKGRPVKHYYLSFIKESEVVFKLGSDMNPTIKLLKKLSPSNSKILESLLPTKLSDSSEIDFYQAIIEQLNANQLMTLSEPTKDMRWITFENGLGKPVLSQKTKLNLMISGSVLVGSPLFFLFIGIPIFGKYAPYCYNDFLMLLVSIPLTLPVIGIFASHEYFRDNLISLLNNRKFYERGIQTKYGLIPYDRIDKVNVVIRSCEGRIHCVTFYFKCKELVVERLICYSEEQALQEWSPIVVNNPTIRERLVLFKDQRKTSRKLFDKLNGVI